MGGRYTLNAMTDSDLDAIEAKIKSVAVSRTTGKTQTILYPLPGDEALRLIEEIRMLRSKEGL